MKIFSGLLNLFNLINFIFINKFDLGMKKLGIFEKKNLGGTNSLDWAIYISRLPPGPTRKTIGKERLQKK